MTTRHLPSPPYNPELRNLVEDKRSWARPGECSASAAKQGFRSWHERGYLPHRDAPGLTQFVTIRLTGSLPASRRGEWAAFLAIEDDRERQRELERYLDRGMGECWLKQPPFAAIVENAFCFFHGTRYDLRAWVVMPNHAHVLVRITSQPLSQVIQNWKRHSARAVNRMLGREGPFWAQDYWDTYMRDADHEARARRYIETNPVRAGLVRAPADWGWSSARFRDEQGELRLPARAAPETDKGES